MAGDEQGINHYLYGCTAKLLRLFAPVKTARSAAGPSC
ncbi:hypothetical protein OU5_0799 [Pseudomonas mandelii JR-1]|uniref:Uncharacterized protein n=1 Tax=Pseudomonas mandelii JR-1 TaxID=1147786 RepID=A0A024E6C9_9PSED|nr:hypothetical protein OU5_0799 [Pseudomonas mandelii JR-1]TWC43277.1 hypothetical protein FBY01_12514 [Pseudomonas sp. SJZ077]